VKAYAATLNSDIPFLGLNGCLGIPDDLERIAIRLHERFPGAPFVVAFDNEDIELTQQYKGKLWHLLSKIALTHVAEWREGELKGVDELLIANPGQKFEDLVEFRDGSLYPWDTRPEILIREGKLVESIHAVQDAIIADTKHTMIFQRAGKLSRIARDGTGTIKNVKRSDQQLLICEVTQDYLWTRMAEAAKFIRQTEHKMVTKDPPFKWAGALMSRSGDDWKFPPLTGIIRTPTLRASDWSLLQTPGYDVESGIFYDPGQVDFGEIPDKPTKDEAIAALNELKEPFEEFPFVDEVAQAVALSLPLTAMVRRSLPSAPLHAMDAPAKGSGKSLIVKAAAYIVVGHEPTDMTYTGDQMEERKKWASVLRNGDELINLDNIDLPLEGATLCTILTSPVFSDRTLGLTEKLSLLTNVTITTTGNNIVIRGDLTRRIITCRIDPKVERPGERRFQRPNLLGWIFDNRPTLVRAGLIMMRAYVAAGMPPQSLDPFGSFEVWSDLIRGTLSWLGCADPYKSQAALLSDDPEALDIGAVLRALGAIYPHQRFTASRAMSDIIEGSSDPTKAQLKTAFETVIPKGLTTVAVGRWLRDNKDTIVDGLSVRRYGNAKVPEWIIEGDLSRVADETPF
jgi:hypothetical protein